MASPIPLLAPVMTTTLSLILDMKFLLSVFYFRRSGLFELLKLYDWRCWLLSKIELYIDRYIMNQQTSLRKTDCIDHGRIARHWCCNPERKTKHEGKTD